MARNRRGRGSHRAYSGRLARMLANRVTDEMSQPPSELLPYPHQNELTRYAPKLMASHWSRSRFPGSAALTV
ncbi:MAG: hypothetical protein ACJ759_08585, partial [Thermoanaerobaculia bacterium]